LQCPPQLLYFVPTEFVILLFARNLLSLVCTLVFEGFQRLNQIQVVFPFPLVEV
jgi:hypothetical protein